MPDFRGCFLIYGLENDQIVLNLVQAERGGSDDWTYYGLKSGVT